MSRVSKKQEQIEHFNYCCHSTALSLMARFLHFALLFAALYCYGCLCENNQNLIKDSKSFDYPQAEDKKARFFYDYQTRVAAYKDLIESRCLLELLKNGDNIPNEHFQNYKVENLPRLSKRRIWTIGGERIAEFCRGFPTFLIQDSFNDQTETNGYNNVKHIRKRETKHFFVGRIRGQTQSQYLSHGNSKDPGKAEAEATYGSSKAVVTGTSGMGQAQSQSSPYGCEDCYDQQRQINQYGPGGEIINGGRPPGEISYPGVPSEITHPTGRGEGGQGPGPGVIPSRRPQEVSYPTGHAGRPAEINYPIGSRPGNDVFYPPRTPGTVSYPGGPGTVQPGAVETGGVIYPARGQQPDKIKYPEGTYSEIPGGVGPGVIGGREPVGVRGPTEYYPAGGHSEVGYPPERRPGEIPPGGQGVLHPGRPGDVSYLQTPGAILQPDRLPYPEGPGRYFAEHPGTIPLGTGGRPGEFQPGTPGQISYPPEAGRKPEGISYPPEAGRKPGHVQIGARPEDVIYPAQAPTGGVPFEGRLAGDYGAHSGQRGKFSGIFSGQYEHYPNGYGATYPQPIRPATAYPGAPPEAGTKYPAEVNVPSHPGISYSGVTGPGIPSSGADHPGTPGVIYPSTGAGHPSGTGGYSGAGFPSEEGYPSHSSIGGIQSGTAAYTSPSAGGIPVATNGYSSSSGGGIPAATNGYSSSSGGGIPAATNGHSSSLGGGVPIANYGYPSPPGGGIPSATNGHPSSSGGSIPAANYGYPSPAGGGIPSTTNGYPSSSGGGVPTANYGYPSPPDGGISTATNRHPSSSGGSIPATNYGYPSPPGGSIPTASNGYPSPSGGSIPAANYGYPSPPGGGIPTATNGYPIPPGGGIPTATNGHPSSLGGSIPVANYGYSSPPGGGIPTDTNGYPSSGGPGYPTGYPGAAAGLVYPGVGYSGTSGVGYPSAAGYQRGSAVDFPGGSSSGAGTRYPSGAGPGEISYPGKPGQYVEGEGNDADSQVQTSIQQNDNKTQASASAQGTFQGGTAQSQVSGTYTGSGSFSASAGSDDGKRGAQTQISGGKEGALTSAQGRGGLGRSQAQVQLFSDTGETISSSQSEGLNHGSQTQVQAGGKGGMADAQSKGQGSTSSQAQINFMPDGEDGENGENSQDTPFKGGGTASAQGGTHTGQSQSQIQGKFSYGIRYMGSAQAGSGAGKEVTFLRNFTNFNNTVDFAPFKPVKLSEEMRLSQSKKRVTLTSAPPPPSPPDTKTANQEDGVEDYNESEAYDEEEYEEVSEYPEEHRPLSQTYDHAELQSQQSQTSKQLAAVNQPAVITQKSKSQSQQVVIEPVENLDVTVAQSRDGFPADGTILQPGQTIPGTGFKIPAGFRGHVKSIANGETAYTSGKHSQAQSVNIRPGHGRIVYRQPVYTVSSKTLRNGYIGYGGGYTYHPYRAVQVKNGKSLPNFVSVSKSETGSTNPLTGKRTPNIIYTQSSSCGVFTNTCVFNSTGRICYPVPKKNPDGSLVTC